MMRGTRIMRLLGPMMDTKRVTWMTVTSGIFIPDTMYYLRTAEVEYQYIRET